ncbi:hypothetical protein CLAFUR4_14504 [Fulvia fulva]|nr:hypothetical protein CLAFUR4_14504 [Fulvia fulva]WPV37580.1 hypothetical protein CLAFUW7_14513 [Fulvia fulva]
MDTPKQPANLAPPTKPSLLRHHQDHLRILAFGNSLTEGYTDFGMRFHPYGNALKSKLSALAPDLTISVDINGQSGDCVLDSLQPTTQSDRIKRAWQYLAIVLGGTNDLAHKLERGLEGSEEIFQGLRPLYEHVLNAGTSLIVMTVPERAIDTRSSDLAVKAHANREHLNRLIVQWAADSRLHREQIDGPKVYFFDLAALVPFPRDEDDGDTTPAEGGMWSLDDLHMTSRGHDFVGNELAAFIKNLL